MLPSLGFQEIVLLAVIALLVVGPKDLPLLFRKVGRWTARLRGMAQEFRTGFDELARQAELDELKREVEALRRTSLQDINRDLSTPPTLEDYTGVNAAPADAPVDAAAADAPDTAADVYPPPEDDFAETPEAPRAVEAVGADRKP
jgi:sec-independent protein translocase protein TatB